MNDFLIGLIAAVILFVFFSLYSDIKKSIAAREHFELYEHVRWCNSRPLRYGSLYYHLSRHNIPIENAYKLTDNEQTIAQEIINFYLEELNKNYFDDTLSTGKSFMKLSEEDYFLFSFLSFMERNCYKTSFYDHTMYTTKDMVDYGSWGGNHFKATYVVTEYGRIYNKLFYLVLLTAQNRDTLKSLVDRIDANTTRELLDTGEIDVSCI